MTSPLGAADFFALEAGECLDRLETLVSHPGSPPAEEFLRTARVLRGSALMTGQTQIARAAGSLETLVRAHRDGKLTWDASTREQVSQAVEEFRLLVRRVREWGDGDTARAARLATNLDSLGGGGSGQAAAYAPPAQERPELHTGVRAFVAREGALIASALDRAARALRTTPQDREPLYNVIRRMQSLRGLAELSDLNPLPEILDGIELGVGDLTRLFAPPPDVDKVMESAGQSLTRISRDVAERGRPDPDAEEARRFTELLLRAFAVERDVVPIESLYFSGDPEPFTQPGSQPQFTAPEPLGPLELVSQGEHLCQTADLIQSSRSAMQRDLRLYHLLGVLRSAGTPSPDPIAGALGIFARSAQEALAAGVASRFLTDLTARLREAGELLRAVGESDDRMLISRRLLDVAHRLDELRTAAPERGVEAPVVPIESLGYDREAEVVPIGSLAPDEPQDSTPVPGIEASFRTFDLLISQRGAAAPSLTALMGQAPAASASVPDSEPVAIGALTYRGHAALERAVTVRGQITARLSRKESLESLQPLFEEL